MQDKDIERVLKIILDKVKDVNWRLEGSANLRVQDVNTSVNDLDITTDKKGIDIFRNSLKKFILKDFFNKKINSDSLIFKINNFEVEVNCYHDKELLMLDKVKIITWDNLNIPILPLDYAKEFYRLIGRKDKVELISLST